MPVSTFRRGRNK